MTDPGIPPASDVTWKVHRRGADDVVARVQARRWIDARTEACRIFNCEPGDVVISLDLEAMGTTDTDSGTLQPVRRKGSR